MASASKITLGADPEFFLYDCMHGEFVAALEANVAGSKNDPVDLGQGYNYHRDNAMLEIGIPPVERPDNLMRTIWEGRDKAEVHINDLWEEYDGQNDRWQVTWFSDAVVVSSWMTAASILTPLADRNVPQREPSDVS